MNMEPEFFNFSMILEENNIQLQQFSLFFKSIDYSEPWIIGLILFHVAMTLFTFVTRKRAAAQAFLFFIMLLLIFVSENINKLGAENWKSFSRQQYFDQHGMFISLVFSLPLLFNCMIMVANWLLISSELMTSIRKFQLQQRLRNETRAVKSGRTKRKSE